MGREITKQMVIDCTHQAKTKIDELVKTHGLKLTEKQYNKMLDQEIMSMAQAGEYFANTWEVVDNKSEQPKKDIPKKETKEDVYRSREEFTRIIANVGNKEQITNLKKYLSENQDQKQKYEQLYRDYASGEIKADRVISEARAIYNKATEYVNDIEEDKEELDDNESLPSPTPYKPLNNTKSKIIERSSSKKQIKSLEDEIENESVSSDIKSMRRSNSRTQNNLVDDLSSKSQKISLVNANNKEATGEALKQFIANTRAELFTQNKGNDYYNQINVGDAYNPEK